MSTNPFVNYDSFNADQKFMVMLQERIETLEELVMQLNTKVCEQDNIIRQHIQNDNLHNSSRCFHMVFRKCFDKEYVHIDPTQEIHDLLDVVFAERCCFLPEFAGWGWNFEEGNNYALELDLFVFLQKPMTNDAMRICMATTNASNVTVLKMSSMDSFQFVENLKIHILPYDQSDDWLWGYELWTSSGCGQLQSTMTTEPFTKSNNYVKDENLQEHYAHMFADEEWGDLMNLGWFV